MKAFFTKYLIYITYFLGIGMTSSGIVLMPFNPGRYGLILMIGLSLFITGSVINEIYINHQKLSKKESLRLIILSLTLAIGIGMISGGIAHFKESPRYVTYLIPIGLVISYHSYLLKQGPSLLKSEKFKLSLGVLFMAVILFLLLTIGANQMLGSIEPGGDIFKDTMEGMKLH